MQCQNKLIIKINMYNNANSLAKDVSTVLLLVWQDGYQRIPQ